MAYFPFYVDIKNKRCVIFGGGRVAYRKVAALLEFDADITVVSPHICEEIDPFRNKINIRIGEYREDELAKAFFVIAATDDHEVNRKIAEACRERGILINVVDEPEDCDFIFPAYIKKGPVTIGISTSGSSPVMAGQIKKIIAANLPEYYYELIEKLGGYRECIKNEVSCECSRADIFMELADIGIKNSGTLTPEEVAAVIAKHVRETE